MVFGEGERSDGHGGGRGVGRRGVEYVFAVRSTRGAQPSSDVADAPCL